MSVSLEDSMGPLLLSTFLSLMIHGGTVHQMYKYFRLYPTDGLFLKVYVASIMVVDALSSAFLVHVCYFYLVSERGQAHVSDAPVWSLRVCPPTGGIVVVAVQAFYARRVYLFKQECAVLVGVAGVIIGAGLGVLIATTVKSFKATDVAHWSDSTGLDAAFFGTTLLADLVLTTTFVVLLRQNRSPFRSTNNVLKTLMTYAVVSTTLIGIGQVPALVLAIWLPKKLYYVAVAIPLTKLYPASMMVFLNCRKSLSEEIGQNNLESFEACAADLTGVQVSVHPVQM
ncbi:hypothetical protein L226DRAFT_616572 [Lentinus tigrinus ALCF2SS1-7]|uniref:DUF6534 domain-containing protein n=1 Tax=Lentinus tigrinus ALCF2SS1-6 TaxID=1328759 RepID=A0A5C2S6J0_9APHY|nr:hypothetical protein L227DRAFT_654557 [Lentinus tigrinus ALCF2SS1-6]RPD69801.1 hypothetical protein L226DRAFT_616572 [Lentinus tigrinus ALCF2SS1-7]